MRIDRIEVEAFGRLSAFDTGPDPLEGLVVVLGPNEAGKSTLFAFLTTALYGFQPASRDRNPHVPWGADRASGLVRIRLDSDGCAEVARTLRSQPTGRLTVAGRTTDLRNQPLPWVSHVPRTVFRQVFAITLGELAGLDEETWARIQDRMIGSMGAADLESPRAAAEALEREAGEIWRPNRRGKQHLRDLQSRLRELRSQRADALERDARIRRLVEEREGIRTDLQTLRARRQLDRAEVDRAQSLLPVRRQLRRIAALRSEGGPIERLQGLPADPRARVEDLEAEGKDLERALGAIEAEVTAREAVIDRARASAAVLSKREEIVRLAARATVLEADRARALQLESEIDDAEARLDTAARSVLTRSWREVGPKTLESVQTELLRERIEQAREWSDAGAAQSAARGHAHWAALATGAALLAWGLATGQALAAALTAAAAAAGAVWWLGSRRSRRQRSSDSGDITRRIDELLLGLPVRPELLEQPGPLLVTGLEQLRGGSQKHTELVRARDATRARLDELQASASALAESVGSAIGSDALMIARELDRALREAEAVRLSASDAERDLPRLAREREDISARVSTVGTELNDLTERVTALHPGDLEAALAAAGDRITAHARADQLEDELLRAQPNLDELVSQIRVLDERDYDWAVDGEALARARARIEEHDERIESFLARAEALDAEVTQLRELDTVDSVDSEVAALREEEARLVRERDRKWVLAQLLRDADRRFREEHQPDLVRRAGSYLQHLTGGRYDGLVVDETHEDHLFHLVGPGLPAPVPLAHPVSTGTLEQAYLSLRLAIVDHLDQGGERLPLFVDEILVNWDDERRARGADVLAGIAATRQIFVFTCHADIADELRERGGRVLELDRR